MFTRKSLFHRFSQSHGEEVKAKNEKQRTRATRARWGPKWEAGALLRKGFRQLRPHSKCRTNLILREEA